MNDKLKMDWIVNGLLAVILVLLAGTYLNTFASKTAHAAGQGGGWETNGIMVTSVSGTSERMVLIDTTKQNIMIYHAQTGGRLGLSGVRNYKYDVEMIDTEGRGKNNPPMTYWDVKNIYDADKK